MASFFHGDGDSATAMRASDFRAAGLEPAAAWPAELCVAAQTMLDAPQPCYLVWGPERAFLYNDAYAPILAERHPQALGRPIAEVWADVWPQIGGMVDAVLAGTAQRFDDMLIPLTRGGATVDAWFSFSFTPLRDGGGAVGGLLCIAEETTERVAAERSAAGSSEELARFAETLEARVAHESEVRRAAEAALAKAQKMEAIGNLTGGVAHDFNNLLQVVSGNLQLLGRDLAANPTAMRRVTNAMAGVARGARLAQQLLAFGRRQPLAPRAVDVAGIVRGMDEMLRRALGEGIAIVTRPGEGLWRSFADPSQIETALVNLAINARDAMDGQGRLTIEIANATLGADHDGAGGEGVAGRYVMLSVSDTGQGMADEVLEHAFEPFFTTKTEGTGSGLGLSMVYGFAKQSGGHVAIHSEPGEGTTVKIYLPRAEAECEVAEPAADGPVVGGSETILVVEDDDDVRGTVVDLLGELGYQVLRATDAASALAVIDSGMAIDLLFTDVIMPGGMKGGELAREALRRLPGLSVLFTSGYPQDGLGGPEARVQLLSKPYRSEALARTLRQVLDAQGPAAPPSAPPSAPSPDETITPVTASRRLTVLFVEDDELVRDATAETLREIGHNVVPVASSEEAIDTLAGHEVDVLLTDLNLPGASGAVLAATARALRPQIGVVLATGDRSGSERVTVPHVLLPKPYGAAGLARVLAGFAPLPPADPTVWIAGVGD